VNGLISRLLHFRLLVLFVVLADRVLLQELLEDVQAVAAHMAHGDARLCDGFVEGHEIECPHHQGRFDIRTGEATGPPAKVAIATYPARIEGGRVLLRV